MILLYSVQNKKHSQQRPVFVGGGQTTLVCPSLAKPIICMLTVYRDYVIMQQLAANFVSYFEQCICIHDNQNLFEDHKIMSTKI